MTDVLNQPKDEPDFFMVWNPLGYSPKVKHDTAGTALNEAKRLARNNPGQQFYVLRAVAKAEIPEPPVHVTKLVHDIDADIPF